MRGARASCGACANRAPIRMPRASSWGRRAPPSPARPCVALWSGNPRPTAVVLGGARVTFGALQAVHDLGIAMPDDLSLVGFGDPAWCAWFGPGLTTLSLPVRDLAFAAASMLLRRVRAGASAEGETESPAEAVFSARLVARGSVAPPSA